MTEYELIPFKTAKAWREWLDKHHGDTDGIWMQLYKKATDIQSITYDEALDVALCYGWIDGQVRGGDEFYYMQKFTPRRKKSMWSKRNTEHVARLIKSGLMMRNQGLLR